MPKRRQIPWNIGADEDQFVAQGVHPYGTTAQRPAAMAVNAYKLYFATDTLLVYQCRMVAGVWTWVQVSLSGTVTSVGLSLPAQFTVTVSPITGSGNLTATLPASMILADGSATFAANQSMGSHKLTSLATGTADSDAVNVGQLNAAIAALAAKNDVQAATVTTLAASTYNNGSAGVGATITLTVAAVLVLDGYTPSLNDRLLIKNQASAFQNGLYALTTVGVLGVTQAVLTRTTDFNQPSDGINGALVYVLNGTTNGNTLWSCTTDATVVFGTTNINWFQFQGATYTADETTLHLSGTTFNLIVPVVVSSGGTGATSFNANGVVLGGATSTGALQSVVYPASSHWVFETGTGAGPGWTSLSTLLDNVLGNAQGDIVYRGASTWTVLTPGTSGQLLQTGGASANPVWATVAATAATKSDQTTGTSTTVAVVPGVQQYHDSAVKCWGFFDGTAGSPTYGTNASYGMSGNPTKNGTGDFTLTFATAFTNTNFSVAWTTANNEPAEFGSRTTTTVRVLNNNSSGGAVDGAFNSIHVCGRQ